MADDGFTELAGLLSWCGQKSEGAKHAGMLKRSAQNAIALVKWLVSFDFGEEDENIFLATFLALPIECYAAMELSLHVSSNADQDFGQGGGSGPRQSMLKSLKDKAGGRSGSRTDGEPGRQAGRQAGRQRHATHRVAIHVCIH